MSTSDTPRTDAHKALDRALIISLCKDKATSEIIADRIEELERELASARADSERVKQQRNDLLILFKAVTLVWGDKLSPETLAIFKRIEDAILSDAARKGGAK